MSLRSVVSLCDEAEAIPCSPWKGARSKNIVLFQNKALLWLKARHCFSSKNKTLLLSQDYALLLFVHKTLSLFDNWTVFLSESHIFVLFVCNNKRDNVLVQAQCLALVRKQHSMCRPTTGHRACSNTRQCSHSFQIHVLRFTNKQYVALVQKQDIARGETVFMFDQLKHQYCFRNRTVLLSQDETLFLFNTYIAVAMHLSGLQAKRTSRL